MRKWLVGLIAVCALLVPPLVGLTQDDRAGRLEITGANATELPTITITANVLDDNNRPIPDLGVEDFILTGELAERARIVQVQNITADDLPFATVLVIDVSSSMDGTPLDNAKAAAQQFVELAGENDPIAIVSFSTMARLVQDFTTDKAVLRNTIENLSFGGQTALYDAGVLAIDVARNAPVSRRAVILLSDGAEFGGASSALREDAAASAAERGVSVYTVGLGFGTDRTYLEELAEGSNARFYESPSPDQLSEIYTDLATLFRTQYVLTLESDLPFDGTTYEFGLQADTEEGVTNVDTGTVRAPIPVPLLSLPDGIFDEPIATPVTVEPNIQADDDIAQTEVLIDGEPVELIDGALTIDPVNFAPGTYPFALRVTDVDGDSQVLETEFEIAALPSDVTVNAAFDEAITAPQTVTLDTEGQTPAVLAGYDVINTDGEVVLEFQSDDAANNFPFTLEPFDLAPGDYTLSTNVLNEGGALATVETPLSVGAVAPRDVIIGGVEAGQELSEPTTITVDATTQKDVEIDTITAQLSVSDAPLGDDLTIVPFDLPPGPATISVVVEDANGLTATAGTQVVIAALPPEVRLSEIPSPISAAVDVPLSAVSQTRVTEIVFQIDDGAVQSVPVVAGEPLPPIPLDAAAIGDGEHTLTVNVTNEGGATTTISETFSVQLPTPTPTATFTPTVTPTEIVPTIDATGTADALALAETGTAEFAAEGTASAEGTLDAQADANAEATSNAEATASVEGETAAQQATLDTQSTIEAQQQANAEATSNAEQQATLDAQATTAAEQQAAEQATLDAQASLDAQATLDTQSTIEAQQDANAEATSNAEQQATLDAQATTAAEQQAAEQATLDAQATLDTESTIEAQQAANAQATTNAEEAAAAEQATLDAQATLDTESTIEAQQDANAQATIDAEEAEEVTEEPTPEETEEVTEEPTAIPTETPTDEETEEPTIAPTQTEDLPTLTPVGGIVEVEGQDAPPAESNQTALLLVACAGGLLLLLLILILRGRRQNREDET